MLLEIKLEVPTGRQAGIRAERDGSAIVLNYSEQAPPV